MRLDRGDGVELAYELAAGRAPVLVFLPGFMSDMRGEKAAMLAAFCAARGQAFLRFDYSGHGASGGAFEDGTIGRWTEDALCVIDQTTAGPLVLAGSSMGGWIALLVARARPARVAGLLGIAAAPDFTERLMWAAMLPAEREILLREGVLRVPSAYGGEQAITLKLIEDGRRHLLLDAPIPVRCPVRLLHGQRDEEVPWETATVLSARLGSEDVLVTLVKDSGHRLSRPQDLALIREAASALLGEDGGQSLAVGGVAPGDAEG
jgi:pimeloyl-ACP methyl ester carboxylesterase